jgi:NAD(P)-dependent dehydrogenase (short-subunit alcohol dehydrogenase family)
MARQLENRVALITGASAKAGIGRAAAVLFAREGAKVVAADVLVGEGEETVRLIKKAGGEALFVKADVSKAADVEAMVKKTVETYGRLDCAFNNAGVQPSGKLLQDTTEEDWERIIGTNLKGVWLCMKFEIPQMLKQGKGTIVNVASMLGLIGRDIRAIYTASKHGVVGLTKVGALENATKGIRVNAICPAVVRTTIFERFVATNPEMQANLTKMTPMGRISTPEEMAEAALWLCSDASSFVTGVAMPVDGGYTAA